MGDVDEEPELLGENEVRGEAELEAESEADDEDVEIGVEEAESDISFDCVEDRLAVIEGVVETVFDCKGEDDVVCEVTGVFDDVTEDDIATEVVFFAVTVEDWDTVVHAERDRVNEIVCVVDPHADTDVDNDICVENDGLAVIEA